MQAQLQHGVDAIPRLGFQLLQAVEVPGIDHQRLFADCISANAQGEAHVGVVQVVGRANGEVLHAIGLRPTPQLLEMPIESLEFSEEPDVESEPIQQADRVMRVDGGHQPVASIGDRLEMAWRDEACHAGDREIFRAAVHALPFTGVVAACALRSRLAASTAAIRGAVRCSEYRSSMVRRPATAMRVRNSVSESRRPSFATHSSCVDARKLLMPSSMISRLTPTAAATTGTPQAMHWMALNPHLPRAQSSSASGYTPTSHELNNVTSSRIDHGATWTFTPGKFTAARPAPLTFNTKRWRWATSRSTGARLSR